MFHFWTKFNNSAADSHHARSTSVAQSKMPLLPWICIWFALVLLSTATKPIWSELMATCPVTILISKLSQSKIQPAVFKVSFQKTSLIKCFLGNSFDNFYAVYPFSIYHPSIHRAYIHLFLSGSKAHKKQHIKTLEERQKRHAAQYTHFN